MRRKQRDSIMVAVQALDRTSNALLGKAAKLARARNCSLDLVHVIALPYAPAVSRVRSCCLQSRIATVGWRGRF